MQMIKERMLNHNPDKDIELSKMQMIKERMVPTSKYRRINSRSTYYSKFNNTNNICIRNTTMGLDNNI
jgi:hypothetical protein